MSKKKIIELQAVNAISMGDYIAPGQLFKVEKEEGERLVAVGAARIPVPKEPEEAKVPAPLTVESLRKDYPKLVEQIEAEAREGYVSKEVASKDFAALQKELDEVNTALKKVQETNK